MTVNAFMYKALSAFVFILVPKYAVLFSRRLFVLIKTEQDVLASS